MLIINGVIVEEKEVRQDGTGTKNSTGKRTRKPKRNKTSLPGRP